MYWKHTLSYDDGKNGGGCKEKDEGYKEAVMHDCMHHEFSFNSTSSMPFSYVTGWFFFLRF